MTNIATTVIPGRAALARARNPYSRWWLWIPGSCAACHRAALRADPLARPGMAENFFTVIASASEAIQLAAKQVWIASSLWLLAMTNSTRLICPPWQIKSGHLGCGKSTRRANQSVWQNPVKQIISEFQKFRLPADPNHFYIPHCPGPQRGVSRIVTDVGQGMRWTRQRQVSESEPDE